MINVTAWVMQLVLWALLDATTLLIVLTGLARLQRLARGRRRARRLNNVRPALFALLDERDDVAKPTAASKDLDLLVLGLLTQMRGADRDELTQFLGRRGVLDRARRQLHSPVALTRAESAERLGDAADPQAIAELTALLRDRDNRVRNAAARALGRIGDPAGASPLLSAMRDPTRPVARSTAGMALLRIGAPATPSLRAELTAADPVLRALCAELLGHLGDLTAQAALLELRRDADEDVRTAACVALGRIGSPQSGAGLASLLGDDQPVPVRSAAAWGLGAIGDPAAFGPLLQAMHASDAEVVFAAAKSLHTVDPISFAAIDCCGEAILQVDAVLALANAGGLALTAAAPR